MSTAAAEDPALSALLLPLRDGHLSWPTAGVLFLRARAGAALQSQDWPGLLCEQSFRPDYDRLVQAGLQATAQFEGTGKFALVMVLPPRQRDESRALLARAVAATAPGGRVLVAAHNNDGARSIESDLQLLAGPVETLSKHKCRVFWTAPLTGSCDAALARQWLDADAPRLVADSQFWSRPGLFAWDRVDPASALLASVLPGDLTGHAADLGSGFGFLSMQLLERCAGIRALDVYEAEQRALLLAQRNLQAHSARVKLDYHWHDVTAGLPRSYDVIVSNPPFHVQQRADRPELGLAFIAAAAASLRPGGCLWLVANRHLPYEAALQESFGAVRTLAQEQGFKVIEAVKRVAPPPRRRGWS